MAARKGKGKSPQQSFRLDGRAFILHVYGTHAVFTNKDGVFPSLVSWRTSMAHYSDDPRSIANVAKRYDAHATWEWRHYFDRSGNPDGPCGMLRLDNTYLASLDGGTWTYLQAVREATENASWDSMLTLVEWARGAGAEVDIQNAVAPENAVRGMAAWRVSSKVLEAIATVAFEDAVAAQEAAVRAKEEGR